MARPLKDEELAPVAATLIGAMLGQRSSITVETMEMASRLFGEMLETLRKQHGVQTPREIQDRSRGAID